MKKLSKPVRWFASILLAIVAYAIINGFLFLMFKIPYLFIGLCTLAGVTILSLGFYDEISKR